MVTIKLIAPNIEEAPAICKLKIAKSTDGPGWRIYGSASTSARLNRCGKEQ